MSLSLLAAVANFLERHRLAGVPGLIAVSGGPDSVALAHALVTLRREGKTGPLALAHVNHQLRGEESDQDARFVAGLADSWGMPCYLHVRDVKEEAERRGENLEGTARGIRYQFLTQQARATGAAWVAAGHTADDQAETVLHRMLRGSGLAGLAGMRENRPLAQDVSLVRPLLEVRRAEVLAYLDQVGQAYRVDRSNLDRSLTRNRLRHELLPALAQYNSRIVETLCQLAEQARHAHEKLEEEARRLLTAAELPRAGPTIVLRPGPLADADRRLVRETFRVLWQREGWPMGQMDFDAWDRMADVAMADPAAGGLAAADFPGGIQARRAERVVQISRSQRPQQET